MLLADRAQFDSQLGALCAGFNVPVTELRSEAYWRGLERMQLSQFARVVSHALGEDGPERIPLVPKCWAIWKQIRHRRPVAAAAPVEVQPPQYDALHGFAQRCLLRFLREAGGVDDGTLGRLVAEKNRLLGQYRLIATEEEITADELRERLLVSFARIAV